VIQVLDYILMAKYEIAWWEAYAAREWSDVESAIKSLRLEQFSVDIGDDAARYFSEACKEYISYKVCHDSGDKAEERKYLEKVDDLIQLHYEPIRDQHHKPEILAAAETGWWDAYHSRQWDDLKRWVKRLRQAQFGVKISDDIADSFVKAGEEYIEHKKRIKVGDKDGAQDHLVNAEMHMRDHYKEIIDKLELHPSA